MLPVNLNDLTPAHIEGLIESEVPESLTLDFKQQLPGKGNNLAPILSYTISTVRRARLRL